MGANYHGETVVRCYHDCTLDGCPTHQFRVMSKHGGFYVEQWCPRQKRWAYREDLPFDINVTRALARVILGLNTGAHKQTSVDMEGLIVTGTDLVRVPSE